MASSSEPSEPMPSEASFVPAWSAQESLGRRQKVSAAIQSLRDKTRSRAGRHGASSCGSDSAPSRSRSRSSRKKESKTSFPRTPMAKSSKKGASNHGKAFGGQIELLHTDRVTMGAVEVSLPSVLHALCSRLRDEEESPEGLFRKAGSAARQRTLRDHLDGVSHKGEYGSLLREASPLDVAALLKQWLRAMPEPMLTQEVQEKLTQDYSDLEGCPSLLPCLLSTLLLSPPVFLTPLVYLLRFLKDVASQSAVHKMDASNLAIVLAPTMFNSGQEAADVATAGRLSAATGREAALGKQTKVLEMLIDNAERVGYLPESLSEEYQLQLASDPFGGSHSEDNLDYDDNGSGWGAAPGPSERRRKKKKRRSGSISRVLSVTMNTVRGLHSKVMSRTNTPVAPGRGGNNSSCYGFEHSMHATPLPASVGESSKTQQQQQSLFTSPRLPKREIDDAHLLPTPPEEQMRKHQGQQASNHSSSSSMTAYEGSNAFTPKARSRSFSVKGRFKRKKSLKGGELLSMESNHIELSNISPLPSKPKLSLALATPGTPSPNDFPRTVDIDSPAVQTTRRSRANLRPESPSPEREKPRRSTSGSRKSRKNSHRSSSAGQQHRKLGEQRRKDSSARRRPSNASEGGKKILITTHTHNTEAVTTSGKKSRPSRRSRSGSKNKPAASHVAPNQNESLVNLREDLQSCIEQSFGGLPQPEDGVDGAAGDLADQMRAIRVSSRKNTPAQQPEPAESQNNRFRRQSSAFEFRRTLRPLGPEIRRQSSAFEIRAENTYENFNRSAAPATRASLRRRNSSVKDLINRLEANRMNSKPEPEVEPPTSSNDLSEPASVMTRSRTTSAVDLSAAEADDWVDASEFFNSGPVIPKHLNVDMVNAGTSGSKRSSIIKIRNRGLVTKSVDAFTRPMTPGAPPTTRMTMTPAKARGAVMPPPQPSRRMTVAATAAAASPAFNACHSRRLSARMGVASLTPVQPSPLNRTGIRTTTTYKKKAVTPTATKALPAASASVAAARKTPKAVENSSSPMVMSAAKSTDRRAKRAEGRRHLTVIGYEGEQVRSPLKERQNVVVTVQRSKSAQTPMHKKPTMLKKQPCATPDAHTMVTRSSSMKHGCAHAQKNKAAVRRHGSVASDSPARARTTTPTIKAALATTPRRLDSGRLARGVEARLGARQYY